MRYALQRVPELGQPLVEWPDDVENGEIYHESVSLLGMAFNLLLEPTLSAAAKNFPG